MAVVGGLPQFKKASDLAGKTGLGLLIFGPPGVGKTTFAATAQDSEFGRDVLMFTLDPGGADSIADRDDIAIWPDPEEVMASGPPTWQQFRKVLDQIIAAGSDSPYKTIVIDSISAVYADLIIPKVVGSLEKQPTQGQWGECNRFMIKMMMDLLSLNAKGINTIFVGHSLDQQDEESTIKYLAGTPKGRDEILRNIGNVGYYDFDRRKVDRVLTFKPQRKVEGPKFRQTRSGKQMPLDFTNPTMGDILTHLRKGK